MDAAGWPLFTYFLGLAVGVAGTLWALKAPTFRLARRRPYDWERECPELAKRPEGHVRVIP